MNYKTAQVTKAKPFSILLTCLLAYFSLIKVALIPSISSVFAIYLKRITGGKHLTCNSAISWLY